MALTHFAFSQVNLYDPYHAQSEGAVVEGKVPSASNQATTAAALGTHKFCRVATDTAVYVSFGTAPNAGTDASRFFMPANSSEYFKVSTGFKAAVITI